MRRLFQPQENITNRISGGRLNGWLEVRDEDLKKYKSELNVLAEDFIWNVNHAHSQGVGLEYFSIPITGSTVVDSSGLFSTLDFANKIDFTKDLKMWVKDSTTIDPEFTSINMDMGISEATITNWYGIEPDGNQAIYKFTVEQGGIVGEDLQVEQNIRLGQKGPPTGSAEMLGLYTTRISLSIVFLQ